MEYIILSSLSFILSGLNEKTGAPVSLSARLNVRRAKKIDSTFILSCSVESYDPSTDLSTDINEQINSFLDDVWKHQKEIEVVYYDDPAYTLTIGASGFTVDHLFQEQLDEIIPYEDSISLYTVGEDLGDSSFGPLLRNIRRFVD